MKSFSNAFGVDPQKLKEFLKDPLGRDMAKNIANDPSLLEIILNNPKMKKIFQNNPILKLGLQNPQIFLSPQKVRMYQNIFKEDEKKLESSRSGMSMPPDSFENSNNKQINQMMNFPGQIPNIDSFNNSDAGRKDIFGNSGINIDYKEKYKVQLSQLKDMGFINEESNIQALKRSNGNINNALENLCKEN